MSNVEALSSGARINLTAEEVEQLREALSAYLSGLHIERARTDNKQFRDDLWNREMLIERLVTELASP